MRRLGVARGTSRLAVAATALAACAPNIRVLRPEIAPAPISLCDTPATCRDSLTITFLGVSGFLIRHGDRAVLTGPSITNPSLARVVLGLPLGPDRKAIEHRLDSQRLDGIDAVLIGHAHYDHLLDVPYMVGARMPDARIYGSTTMKHLLAGDAWLRAHGNVVAVADSAGSAWKPGHWIYARAGGLRYMPIRSSHARNWLWFTLAPGEKHRDRDDLPGSAWTWKLGVDYAWIIDIIRPDSTPVFRIFYQDAASRPAHNVLPPFAGRDQRAVDIAILCVGNYAKATDYPTVLLAAVRPRYAILGHWEDFFRSGARSLRVVPFTDTERLVGRLRAGLGERWITPAPPATTMRFLY